MIVASGTVALLATFCFLGQPTSTNSELTGYDCSPGETVATGVSILKLLPPCETITHAETIAANIIERKETRVPVVPAYRCKVTYIQSLVEFSGSSRVVSNGTEIIGRDACLKAHETKTIELSGKLIPFVNTNGTITQTIRLNRSHSNEGSISGDGVERGIEESLHERQYDYQRFYEITLSKGVGTVNLHQNIITFDNGIDCDYNNFSCGDDSGEIFWSPRAPETGNAGAKLLFTGHMYFVTTNLSITSDRIRYAIVQRDALKVLVIRVFDSITIHGGKEYRTEIPNVYIVQLTEDNTNYEIEIPSIRDYGWEDADTLDDRAESYHSRYPMLQTEALQMGQQRCEEEDTPAAFRRLDSGKLGSKVEFSRKGMVGVRTSLNMFSIYKCAESKLRRRKTEQCYDQIAVKDTQNRDKFLNPFSRVLRDHATPLRCEHQGLNNTVCKNWDVYIPAEAGTMGEEYHGDLARDWVKIGLVVLVSLWGVAILVRIIKMVVRRKGENRVSISMRNGNSDNELYTVYEYFKIFSPPVARF